MTLAEAKKLMENMDKCLPHELGPLDHADGDYKTCAWCYCKICGAYRFIQNGKCKECIPKDCDCGEQEMLNDKKDIVKKYIEASALIAASEQREKILKEIEKTKLVSYHNELQLIGWNTALNKIQQTISSKKSEI